MAISQSGQTITLRHQLAEYQTPLVLPTRSKLKKFFDYTGVLRVLPYYKLTKGALPVEGVALDRAWNLLTEQDEREEELLKLHKLNDWAIKAVAPLTVLDPLCFSLSRRQNFHHVPTYACFNVDCTGTINFYVNELGLASGYWHSPDGHRIDLPKAIFDGYRDAFRLPLWNSSASYSFSFSGLIPQEQRRAIQEVKNLKVGNVYMLMEVPKGAWQINGQQRVIDIFDPLLLVEVGTKLVVFDCFDLTDAERYAKDEFTTALNLI